MKGLLTKLFMLMSQALTKSKNKRTNKEVQRFVAKEEYFIKNGAILLEKNIALSQGKHLYKGSGLHRLFSEAEIRKATRNYDPVLIVGRYRRMTFYKATLDGRSVTIAACEEREPSPMLADLILTMAVYELFPWNFLHGYLHGDMALQKPLTWSDRLRIATDISYGLSYMHNAFSKPVVIRDIVSSSIVIDTPFCAKLSNYAHSVSIPPGKKEVQLPVHGVPGYIDPEYIKTGELTEKCDVYNLGVLMLELLTARDPVEMATCGRDLVDEFFSAVEKNGGLEMIDKRVLEEGNVEEMRPFVRLALACVAKEGVARPTMTEVVDELWAMQDQDM